MDHPSAMTSAQSRIAETLETFYGAADTTSEGAMAAHAYKRAIDDIDGSFGRELVRSQTLSCNRAIGLLVLIRMSPTEQPSRNL